MPEISNYNIRLFFEIGAREICEQCETIEYAKN